MKQSIVLILTARIKRKVLKDHPGKLNRLGNMFVYNTNALKHLLHLFTYELCTLQVHFIYCVHYFFLKGNLRIWKILIIYRLKIIKFVTSISF